MKRYTINARGTYPADDGEWVWYADVDALQAENTRLRDRVSSLDAMASEIARLRTENARLRALIDRVLNDVSWHEMSVFLIDELQTALKD